MLRILVDAYDLIDSKQGGFRKGHSLIDHVFVLKILIDVYLDKQKRILLHYKLSKSFQEGIPS